MTGSRGPLPKPHSLRVLEGNAGKRPLDVSAGVHPKIEIPPSPSYLGKEAKKEWKRITPILYELGLLSGLDRAALGLYCQAQGRLTELEQAMEGMIGLKVSEGSKYVDSVYAASQSVTPSGYAQQSVIVQLISKNRAEVNRYLMHFGLSPAARGRVQASNYADPTLTLPGFEKPESPAGFAKFRVA